MRKFVTKDVHKKKSLRNCLKSSGCEAPRSENPRRTGSYGEGLSDAGNEADGLFRQFLKHNKRGTENLTVHTTLQGKLPRLPFASLKEALLGKHYCLSIVFIGDALSRRLNKTYRGKNAPANVLGFPLSTTEGELFINPHQARKDAPSFGLPAQKFLLLLVIHGMLHLKGYAHGRTMSAQARRLMQKFSAKRARVRA